MVTVSTVQPDFCLPSCYPTNERRFTLLNDLSTLIAFQIAKGRFHGTVDVGLSVLTYKKHGRRIDIDAEDLIYHLKVLLIKCLILYYF